MTKDGHIKKFDSEIEALAADYDLMLDEKDAEELATATEVERVQYYQDNMKGSFEPTVERVGSNSRQRLKKPSKNRKKMMKVSKRKNR